MASLVNLNNNCSSEILSYLSENDIRSFSAVNKEKYRFVSNYFVWKNKLNVNNFKEVVEGKNLSIKRVYEASVILNRRVSRFVNLAPRLYMAGVCATMLSTDFSRYMGGIELGGNKAYNDPLIISEVVLLAEFIDVGTWRRLSDLPRSLGIELSREQWTTLHKMFCFWWGAVGIGARGIFSGVGEVCKGNCVQGSLMILMGSLLAAHFTFSKEQKRKFLSAPLVKCARIWTQIQVENEVYLNSSSVKRVCFVMVKFVKNKVAGAATELKQRLLMRLIPNF